MATKKAKKPKKAKRWAKRGEHPHKGVTICAPKPPRKAWRLRFTDPETGKLRWESLDADAGKNADTRFEAAVAKREELEDEAARIAREGKDRAIAAASVKGGLDRYFADHPLLRERTVRVYRDAADKLEAWASEQGIKRLDALDRAALVGFRARLVNEPRKRASAGGPRGTYEETAERRAAPSVNREIRAIKTILEYLRLAGLTPKITGDDLRDALKQLKQGRPTVEFLRPAELGAALEAVLAYDAERHKITREENAGLRPVGTTPKNPEIGPFALTAILTGARLGELLTLEWSDVFLDAPGEDGERMGELRIRAAKAKTGIGRVVDFSPTPSLLELLDVLRERDGGEGRVFNLTREQVAKAARKLRKKGAPESFGWQAARRTCATYSANAPFIGMFKESKRLGHSVVVSERAYAGLVNVPKDATTLEQAMGIEEHAEHIIAAAKARKSPPRDRLEG